MINCEEYGFFDISLLSEISKPNKFNLYEIN